MLEDIDHVGISVSDLREAREFYHERLGLQADALPDDAAFFVAHSAGVSLTISQGSSPADEKGAVTDDVSTFPLKDPLGINRVLFRVGDLDTVVAQLREKGIDIEHSGTTLDGRYARFRDPDGNILGLVERHRAHHA